MKHSIIFCILIDNVINSSEQPTTNIFRQSQFSPYVVHQMNRLCCTVLAPCTKSALGSISSMSSMVLVEDYIPAY